MKRVLMFSVILFSTWVAEANENSSTQSSVNKQYHECVAVSLYTMQANELNSIVKNNRTITGTNTIPEGWTVIGVTTKTESDIDAPYLVICH